jgi:hypothetical protein
VDVEPPFLVGALDGGEWSGLPPGKEPHYSLGRRLGGPQSRYGDYWEEKDIAPAGIRTPAFHPVSRRRIWTAQIL